MGEWKLDPDGVYRPAKGTVNINQIVSKGPAMTLEEVSKRLLPSNTWELLEEWKKEHEAIMRVFGPPTPPTRWQHLSYPFRLTWWRVRDAALVLIGKKEAI